MSVTYGHAQDVTVKQGKQYTNKAASQSNINQITQDIQDIIDDIAVQKTALETEIDGIEQTINDITPTTCTSINKKPTWNGTSWVCQNDETGTFKLEGSWNTGSWSGCSRSCGGGTQSRSVTCPSGFACTGARPTSAQICNTHACTAAWQTSTWSAWSTCSKTCGSGTQTRTRTVTCPVGFICTAPKPATTASQTCNTQACLVPQNGVCGSANPRPSCVVGSVFGTQQDSESMTCVSFDMDKTRCEMSTLWRCRGVNGGRDTACSGRSVWVQ